MKLKSPGFSLLCAVMFPAALPVQATPEKNFATPFMSGFFQVPSSLVTSGVEDKLVGKLQGVRLNGKDLLNLISEETEIEFPRGARLLVDLDSFKLADKFITSSALVGGTFVVDRNGAVLVNASPYVIVTFNFDDLIFSGVVDFENDKEKTKNRFPATVQIIFPHRDIDVLFTGNCFENFSMSAPNNQGEQRVKGTTRFQGEGSGFFDDNTFIGSLDMLLKGNELVED
jgi:hypothetical protein